MYKLYRNPNGQVEQVPINNPIEDTTPPKVEEAFPDPLEAKGEPKGIAPFVIQQNKQFDIIKENEGQQAKFQTQKLQWNNYQIVNFQINVTDASTVQAYFVSDYNSATAVGVSLNDCIMFGTDTTGVDDAKYYNIVYVNARLNRSGDFNKKLQASSYVEFYTMKKLPNNPFYGCKIPRQIEAVTGQSSTNSITATGTQYGVQSFGVDIYNENAYYTQTADLYGIRSIGLALKRIVLNFDGDINIGDLLIDIEVGYDLKTEGNNY